MARALMTIEMTRSKSCRLVQRQRWQKRCGTRRISVRGQPSFVVSMSWFPVLKWARNQANRVLTDFASSISAFVSSGFDTSARKTAHFGPSSLCKASSPLWFTSPHTTLAPFSTRVFASSAPIPVADPVITATVSEVIFISCSVLWSRWPCGRLTSAGSLQFQRQTFSSPISLVYQSREKLQMAFFSSCLQLSDEVGSFDLKAPCQSIPSHRRRCTRQPKRPFFSCFSFLSDHIPIVDAF